MRTSSVHRRAAAALGGLALAASVLAACGSSSDTAEPSGDSSAAPELSGQIVWADYGGKTNEAWNDVFFGDFTDQTGVDVVSTVIDASIMYGMLGGDEGDYDAIMVAPADIENYKDHILKLPEGVSRSDTIDPAFQDYAIGTMWVGYAQGYLTETFPDGGPTTWADFWDTEKFPGKRAVPGVYSDYMYEAALLADGVAPEDLYPIDYARAEKKLDELRPDMIFYQEYPEIQQLLSSGSVAIAFGPSGQYATLAATGADVTTVWDNAFVEANPWVVPEKAPDADNVFALADFLGDPEKQAEFAELTHYGPANSEAFQYIDPEVVDTLANSPSHTNLVTVDPVGRAADYDPEYEAYTAWLAK